jgi:hypothetical protein
MWWDNSFSLFQLLMISATMLLAGVTLGYLLRVGWMKSPVAPPQMKDNGRPAPSTCVHCGNHVTWEQWLPSRSDDPVVWLCPYCRLAKGRW